MAEASPRPPDVRPRGATDEARNSLREAGRTPGWREVILVAAVVVGLVLGLAVLTSLLPVGAQDLIFRTPLAIVVLAAGTVGLLVGLWRRPGG